MTSRRLAFAFLLLAAVVWTAAIVTAPSALRAPDVDGRGRVAAFVYLAGSLVCHQRPERSFHTAGVPWPVCARCAGLYLGAAAGLLLWPAVRRRVLRWGSVTRAELGARRRRRFTIAVAVPTALTVAAATLGLFDPPNLWRAALAVPLGAWVSGVLAAVTLGDLT